MKLIDIEAEERIISAMLRSDNACAEAISTLTEKDFAEPFNLCTFSIVHSLFIGNIKPTIAEVLKEGLKTGLIEGQQHASKLREISSHYVDDENINYWIQQVKTKAQTRRLTMLLEKYQQTLQIAKDSDAETIIEQASEEFAELSILSAEERIKEPGEIAKLGYDLVVSKMEKYREAKSANPYGAIVLDGVPTGLENLDAITLGYKPGDLILLGAQTGHGKTAYALNTIEAGAIKANNPILYINTEMRDEQIALRWGCILSGIDHDKIRNGAITNDELTTIAEAYAELEQSGFYSVYIPNLTASKLQSEARKARLKKGVKLIIIDYIGRIDTTDPRLQEWQTLYNIIKAQKQMAQNLDCAVMVLVQLNPDGTIQGAKKMQNECDLMLKLVPVSEEHVENYAEKTGIRYENWNYELKIEKNRDGVSGNSIPLFFDQPKQRIKQAVKQAYKPPSDDDSWAKYGKEIRR